MTTGRNSLTVFLLITVTLYHNLGPFRSYYLVWFFHHTDVLDTRTMIRRRAILSAVARDSDNAGWSSSNIASTTQNYELTQAA